MAKLRAPLALLLLLSAGCLSPSTTQAHASPSVRVQSFAGGCAGTTLTDALPPAWAQGGWSLRRAPWGVPWALGSGGEAVAYVFATQLVAGTSPRVDGTNNKVLWVARGAPSSFTIEARPLGSGLPVVTIAGGPSIVDLPTAGCWTFHLTWDAGGGQAGASIINLNVLPAGSAPSTINHR